MIMVSADSFSSSGLIWDGKNYSCVYDAFFTVLFEIWSSDTKLWTTRFKELINTNSSHCLLVSKNILMNRPVLKLLEILSGMSCIHKIPHNFLMAREAQVLQP